MVTSAAIVLAAGQGTRMRSRVPKVLHPIAGRPMIEHVLATLADAGVELRVVVTGHEAEQVEAGLDPRIPTVRQQPQLGTADAVRCGLGRVPGSIGAVIVTMGDAPLLPAELVTALAGAREAADAAISVLTARRDDPAGYGRVVRGPDGTIERIVEEADLDPAAPPTTEINTGTYCFDAAWLRTAIGQVPASASGEYYLTDLVALALAAGRRVVALLAPRAELTMGINDRVALAAAEALARDEIIRRHQENGVTVVDPGTTWIDAAVEIGQDARIEPWTVLRGATVIGQDAVIGPRTELHGSRIGPRTRIWASVIEESVVAEDAQIGPYSHLRPGCQVGPRCVIGNFAEMKKTRMGAGTQQHHFSYLGDAEVGDAVNIGAGSVTANYDGSQKYPTVIGDHAFIGVDTMLRAPITIGPGARTGAGAVVTRDVPPGKTVVGMPARAIDARRRSTEERDPAKAGTDPSSQQGGSRTPPNA